jgi:DNA-binding beta-propeller fold protein YncE
MSLSSLSTTIAGAVALALLPAAPATAAPFPERVPLQAGSRPEGIAGGPGTTYYAGSRLDGAVYTGDLRTGSREVLVPGNGGVAVGMQYDPATKLLWVAGGGTGTITAVDTRRRTRVLTLTAPTTTYQPFLNDVDVTSAAVWVTDSRNARLLRVDRASGTLSVLPLSGDWDQAPPPAPTAQQPSPQPPNSANGIRALPSGDLLVVNRGSLYAVDPATGAADRVEVSGTALTGGDGLELVGDALYVVFGKGTSTVSVLTLGAGGRTAAFVRDLPVDAARPTTMTVAAGRGWVVDGDFADANAPANPHDVVQVRLS